MECNKEDAIKAKVTAERMLQEKDFAGAKRLALKAQSLYPELDGLFQLITTINIYIAGEKKLNGEVDWYQVLGVTTTANNETIRKQYHKLALMLHPDKNRCMGADDAFKIVSEAWSLISDKAKRSAYDQRRSSFGTTTTRKPTLVPRPPIPNSFWTKCKGCNRFFEYLRIYRNQNIRCTYCYEFLKAIEAAPPQNFSQQPGSTPQQTHRNPAPISSNPKAPQSSSRPPSFTPQINPVSSNPKPPNPLPNQIPTAPNTILGTPGGVEFRPASIATTATVGPPVSLPSVVAFKLAANEKMKRPREESQVSGGLEKRRVPERESGAKINVFKGVNDKDMSTRRLTQSETRQMLINKARSEITRKLNQLSTKDSAKNDDSTKLNDSDANKKGSVKTVNGKVNKKRLSSSVKGRDIAKKSSSKTCKERSDSEINVPDPDFYDFDQDRKENSFGENQVWAGYDDDDEMPRLYALVHKVISLNPFKMRVSWLETKTNNEFSNMNWVGSGFYKTCGEFTVGKPKFTKFLNSFSHKVEWVRGSTGSICILPKKGQVWALYQNWSPDWNELVPDEVMHKYDMVEVVEDYSEDQGISVAPLVKVCGFRTVFRTLSGPADVKRIPREEMFRFSHQVPNHLLTGQEAESAPKGFQELDPASTPVELIQEITENEKKSDEHMTENVEENKIVMTCQSNN